MHILVELVRGGFVEHDGVVGLVLDCSRLSDCDEIFVAGELHTLSLRPLLLLLLAASRCSGRLAVVSDDLYRDRGLCVPYWIDLALSVEYVGGRSRREVQVLQPNDSHLWSKWVLAINKSRDTLLNDGFSRVQQAE